MLISTEAPVKHRDKISPLLRWAGSKRQLIARLKLYWHSSHNRYFEPFAGSACLFFEIQPERAFLGDLNIDLIQTYQTVRQHPEHVFSMLVGFPKGPESYYLIRNQLPLVSDGVKRAAMFMFLNRFCFNGIYRTNLSGVFNVPFASNGTGDLPDWETFRRSSLLLRRAELVCDDFTRVIGRAGKGDFVYLDPPYAVSGRRVFNEYGPRCFGLNDLERLKSALRRLDARGADFLLSYADCPDVTELQNEWYLCRLQTRRSIAADVRFRRHDTEVLVSNFRIEI